VGSRTTYHLKGIPRQPSQIDYMLVDVSDESTPIVAQWFLHGGGKIVSTIETQMVGAYVVPKHERADIDVDGTKIHAEMTYGEYALNSEVSDAKF
jgi:hypothetical protein